MNCLIYFGMSSMKEGTSAQLSGRGELHGGARVTTLVTLRKCTLGNKREIKTLKFVLASTKGFKGGLAWIKPSKKDMAVTFSYSRPCIQPSTSTHKRTFSGGECEGSHSSHEAGSKSTVVRAITTTELRLNLKPILSIGKGPDCVQNVRSLRIRPQRNHLVHQL